MENQFGVYHVKCQTWLLSNINWLEQIEKSPTKLLSDRTSNRPLMKIVSYGTF